MAYPKITVNTGQALIVVPSDTIPIPNPNFIAATGVGNQVDNGANTSVVTNKLVDTGATWTATTCLLYTSPSPRDRQKSRMPSSA